MRRRLEHARSALRLLLTIVTAASAVLGSEAAEPRSTVRGNLQPGPGMPRAMLDARVEPAPTRVSAVAADDANLSPGSLVLGVVVEGKARAYPIRNLAGNEVVGDRLAGRPIAVTWCPLSGSGAVFDRTLDERELTFDFVWGLVNDNLVLTDRETGSVWSQLAGEAVDGPMTGRVLERVAAVQTTWAGWKRRQPDTDIGIVPGAEERAYVYFDAGDGSPMNRMMGTTEHDTSTLGLGLEAGAIEAFFPLHALPSGGQPLRIDVAGTLIVIHRDPEGMTAWAELADGRPLPGVLAYQRSWTAFHPSTRVWGGQPSCGTGE